MPTILATFSSCDLKLWPVTVTYELDLDKVKLNHRAKYLGESSGHFVRKLLCGHTHRHTDTHTTNRLRYTATKWSVNTPWAIIRSQLIFVCNFVKKTNFNAVYDVRFRNERHMRQYELHPPHLINVATLSCENQKNENVTLQRDMTKENCIRCIIASSKWIRVIMCLKFTYGCYTAKLAWNKDSRHRRSAKTLDANLFRMQTCFDFDRNIIDAGVTMWDYVLAGGGYFKHMLCSDTNVHLYDPPEHFMKLSM